MYILVGRCIAVDRGSHVFCSCVYRYVICYSPLGVFGARFALLGVTLGCLLGAFGAPWAPKGLSLASLWLHFGGSLRMPLSPFGAPWLPDLNPDFIPDLSRN